MKGGGKTGELLTAQNANENSMWRDSSLRVFAVFFSSSLERLLQTTPPVSAPVCPRPEVSALEN